MMLPLPSTQISPLIDASISTRPIGKIRHEIGLAYISITDHPELSSHDRPSSAIVLEDGVPLPGPANATHNDIRRLGAGRFSFWHNVVYFSTPDNSDPRTNGRDYSIAYTPLPFGRFGVLVPCRWFRKGVRTVMRLTSFFAAEQRQQALWGALYWLCFAYILWRGNKASRAKRS